MYNNHVFQLLQPAEKVQAHSMSQLDPRHSRCSYPIFPGESLSLEMSPYNSKNAVMPLLLSMQVSLNDIRNIAASKVKFKLSGVFL